MAKAAWVIASVALIALFVVTILYVQATSGVQVIPAVPTHLDIYGSNDWWTPRDGHHHRRARQRGHWRGRHD
jgi:hypothetical protein